MIHRIGKKTILSAAAGITALAFAGGAFAMQSANSVLLKGPLYGNIPNVAVRGVPAGKLPWVVKGLAVLTPKALTVTGQWLLVPDGGYTSTGAPVPKAMWGTTIGVKTVAAEITFANGQSMMTKPAPLSPKGDFTIHATVNVPAGDAQPIVLVGPVIGGKLVWFASTDYLTDYGMAKPGVMKSWSHTTKPSAARPGVVIKGKPAKSGSAAGSSSSSSGSW